MGFLKRIFSIGSKKNKKRPHIVHNVNTGLRAIEEEEHEAAIGRLLRSSSARYAIVSELDYASLPPLPHPINDVIQTPAASSASIASTSVSQRGTYTVTVHRRKQHSLTKFPNPEYDALTHQSDVLKENSQLLGLRSDPSVASLLDMYDEHGRIAPDAFSNSPPSPKKGERAQTRRNGSTLRQLLGNPSSLNSRNANDQSGLEGDISWAERFLGETDSISSASSLGLRTPNTPDAHFLNDSPHDNNVRNDTSFFSDYDISSNTMENPAISSMEVELSIGAESTHPTELLDKSSDPTTPQRASQIFTFLTEKRRPVITDDDERSLPELPSAFSFSSEETSPIREARSHFSSDGSSESVCGPSIMPAIPPSSSNDTPVPLSQVSSSISCSTLQSNHRPPSTTPFKNDTDIVHVDVNEGDLQRISKSNDVKVIMTGPTRVIVTAPTPSTNRYTTNRVPRGPRSQSRRFSSENTKPQRSINPTESSSYSIVARDPFTPVLPRRESHRRSTSQRSTSTTSHSSIDVIVADKHSSRRRSGSRSILTELNKENDGRLAAKSDIPSTPLRSKSHSNPRDSRSLFRTAVNPNVFRPPAGMTPSPASSSELSPVGRQLMMNLRQQRTKAREADRKKSSHGTGRFGRTSIVG